MDQQCRFFREVFFPAVDEMRVEAVAHHGDLVDRRKFVNYKTAHRMRATYLDEIARRRLRHDIIPGNHDISFRDTLEVNALRELVEDRPGHTIHVRPTVALYTPSFQALMLPWICASNAEESLERIGYGGDWCMAHLELAGFEMQRGNVHEKGMSPRIFEGFDQVTTAHFHHGSTQGNIQYLGAPYEMDWSDAGCPRGFHVLDTETRDMTFVRNPFTLHERLGYSDEVSARDLPLADLAGKFIRLTYGRRENHSNYDEWVRALEDADCEVKPIEDRVVAESTGVVAHTGNTLSTMHRYVDDVFLGEDREKDDLKHLLADVYREAAERQG